MKKRMEKIILFGVLLLQVIFVKSVEVTFGLIAVSGQPSVLINGQQTLLELDEYPVYKKKIDVTLPVNYQYVLNGETESFTRTYTMNPDLSKQKTLNEFFNRRITTKEHPLLPRAFEKYQNSELSKLYDDTHVATIIIKVPEATLATLYTDTHETTKARGIEVFYATPYGVKNFSNATLGLSGQSTVDAAKLSYKLSNLKDDKNKELFQRTSIKLRAEHMDPSFMRDKIYGDILNSVGVPCPQNKFARVYINERPVGLFVVSDDVASKRFLRESLNKGEKYTTENSIFKADYYPGGGSWGDLTYYDENVNNPKYSIYIFKGENDEDPAVEATHKSTHLLPLLRDIKSYPTSGVLNMDIEMFIKFMAVEFLCGGVDNFWQKPGNYFIFKDVAANKWYFLDTDFHFSFGVGGEAEQLIVAKTDTFVTINKEIPTTRPLVDGVFSFPKNKEYYNNVLKRLLETAFNEQTVIPRIESLTELIKEDAEYDFSLPRENKAEKAEIIADSNIQTFIKHTSGEDVGSFKYWLKVRGSTVAQEINMQYPPPVDNSLGMVETPLQKNKDSVEVVKNASSFNDGSSFTKPTYYLTIALIVFVISLL